MMKKAMVLVMAAAVSVSMMGCSTGTSSHSSALAAIDAIEEPEPITQEELGEPTIGTDSIASIEDTGTVDLSDGSDSYETQDSSLSSTYDASSEPAYEEPVDPTCETEPLPTPDAPIVSSTETLETEEVGDVMPISASEAFHTKSIWFGVDDDRDFAKNSWVQAVYAFDGNGNVTVYNNADSFKFSMINAEMTDDEVLEIVKGIEMESRAAQGIDGEPQPQPIDLVLYTDNSGNLPDHERIRYVCDGKGLTDGLTINRDLELDYPLQPIYDMQFGGYDCMKMRISDPNTYVGFNFDTVDTPGIEVW